MTAILRCLQLGFMQQVYAIWLYSFIEEEDKVSDGKEIIGRMRKMKAGEYEMTDNWEYFGSRTKPCAESDTNGSSCDSRAESVFPWIGSPSQLE